MSCYSMIATISTYARDQSPASPHFNLEEPDWDQFNFEPLTPYTFDDGYALAQFPAFPPYPDFDSLLLSSPESSQYSTTPSLSSLPSPNLPSAESPLIQPPAAVQPTSLVITTQPLSPGITVQPLSPMIAARPTSPATPQSTPPLTTVLSTSPPAAVQLTPPAHPPIPTPQTTAFQPGPEQITRFDFCPFTRHGQICGHVSWASSANKHIKRHLKADHFPATSLGYECPNPRCSYENFRFLRKDACDEHRKACNLMQAPDYVPLPNIETGSDVEVDRWMRARLKQRKSILAKLRKGTRWSRDLLEPVSLQDLPSVVARHPRIFSPVLPRRTPMRH